MNAIPRRTVEFNHSLQSTTVPNVSSYVKDCADMRSIALIIGFSGVIAATGQQLLQAAPLECSVRTVVSQPDVKIERLELDLSSARLVTSSGEYVYWISDDGLGRMNLKTRAVESLTRNERGVGSLAVDEKYAYWSECQKAGCGPHGEFQAIIRFDLSSRERVELVRHARFVTALAVDEAFLFWAEASDDHLRTGWVHSVSKFGGPPRQLWKGDGVTQLIRTTEALVWITSSQVVELALNGTKTTVVADGLIDGRAIAADSSSYFYVDGRSPRGDRPGTLSRFARTSKTAVVLAANLNSPTSITLDKDWVYIALQSGELAKIGKGGGRVISLALEDKPEACLRTAWLSTINGDIFWARVVPVQLPGQTRDGQLWRLKSGPRDGR
jgi:hypothetical protein